MIQITTGEPTNAVMTLIGNTDWLPGNWAIISHSSISEVPTRQQQGMRIRWSEEWNSDLARCGTAIPIKPIGPQKAVILPVSKQVLLIIKNLDQFTVNPMLRA